MEQNQAWMVLGGDQTMFSLGCSSNPAAELSIQPHNLLALLLLLLLCPPEIVSSRHPTTADILLHSITGQPATGLVLVGTLRGA